eukprot:s83_g34.t1
MNSLKCYFSRHPQPLWTSLAAPPPEPSTVLVTVMAVHPGHVAESAVVPGDLQYVWELIKSMQFKFFKQVVQAKRQEGDDGGALGQFTIAYSDNTVQTLRVTEISERAPLKRSIGMEMVASDPPVGYSARTDLITLSAITHADRPCVFVEQPNGQYQEVQFGFLFRRHDGCAGRFEIQKAGVLQRSLCIPLGSRALPRGIAVSVTEGISGFGRPFVHGDLHSCRLPTVALHSAVEGILWDAWLT